MTGPNPNPNPEPNPNPNPEPKTEPQPDSGFKVPEELRDAEWAKEVKDVNDLWSRTAGLYKKLGKNPIIPPGENAAQDEIEAFRNALGRPESPDGYEFKNIAPLKDVERNPETDKAVKQVLHKYGVRKEDGEAMIADLESLIYEKAKPGMEDHAKKIQEQQAKEEAYNKLVDTTLGPEKEETISAFKSVMKEALGDKAYLQDYLKDMKNEELVNLMVFGKAIHDKYSGESKVNRGGDGNVSDLTGDLKTDYQTLSQRKLNVKLDKTIPEHIKKDKVAKINQQIASIGEKAKDAGINLFAR